MIKIIEETKSNIKTKGCKQLGRKRNTIRTESVGDERL